MLLLFPSGPGGLALAFVPLNVHHYMSILRADEISKDVVLSRHLYRPADHMTCKFQGNFSTSLVTGISE